MADIPKKSSWQERVKQVEIYHVNQLKDEPNWRLADTARELNRSIGRVSEDLMLASWMRTHPKVATFEKVQDALDYVRSKKRTIRLSIL
jgi:hypothetical protein